MTRTPEDIAAGRQYPTPTLADALARAIRHLRHEEQNYRNPHGEPSRRMSKQMRQNMAADYAGHVRALENHLAAILEKDSRHG